MQLRIDLHVHTRYSEDCNTTLDEVVKFSKRKGLDGVAVTDHGTVEGAIKLLERDDLGITVIPGLEIGTRDGHVIGLNIEQPVEQNMSVKETVEKIHEAGGIAVAPHPSAIYKNGIGLGEKILSSSFDAVEVVNASVVPFSLLTYFNRRFVKRMNLAATAGSDSHLPETIGLAYTIIENSGNDSNIETIIACIRKGSTIAVGKGIPCRYRLKKIMQKRRDVVT